MGMSAKSYCADDDNKMKSYMAMDEMDDDEMEEYMAYRAQRYEGEGDNASGEYNKELGGASVDHDETSGKTPYEAEGSADDEGANPSGTGTADGEVSVTAGTVDDEGGAAGKNSASTYARNGNGKGSVQYQRLQVEVRKQSDRSDKLAKDLQSEQYKRVDAERYTRMQELVLQGFALEPDKEMERLSRAKVNDEQFDAHIKAITENYHRVPDMILPYSRTTAFDDPSRPGGRAEQERYTKSAADLAGSICMSKIQNGEEPDYTQVLREVKEGKHGDVSVA